MTRARDVSRLITTPPSIYATDSEASAGYLTLSSASSTYLTQNNSFLAGKNKIINGDFGIWQRGTGAFTTNNGYTTDRFVIGVDAGSFSATRSTFTPGTAPVSGYEGNFFLTVAFTASANNAQYVVQRIEDVRTFAGQTVTLSYWAKASTNTLTSPLVVQNFGSGGSAQVVTSATSTATISTTWTRYSFTINVPSITGKTVGTSSFLEVQLSRTTTSATLDFWGVQVEAGSIATPFVPAGGGSQQAELSLCQRYYQKSYNQGTNPGTAPNYVGVVVWSSVTTGAFGSGIPVYLKTTMRATPTVTIYNPETGATGSIRGLSAGNNFAGTAEYIGDNGFSMYATATQSSAGFLIGTHYVAQIEL